MAQAGGLILLTVALLSGQVWARPAVEWLQKAVSDSVAREDKLASALTENTATMRSELRESRDELREVKGELKELRDQIKDLKLRTPR